MLIKKGSRGENVIFVQEALYEAGFLKSRDDIDGIFGNDTYKAVVAFQEANGLKPDGVVGQVTYTAFSAVSSCKPLEGAVPGEPHQITMEWIIRDKTAIEAGYVNHPDDPGKETNHGITRAVAEAYKDDLVERFGWDGTMINLTTDMAYYIYVMEYWVTLNLDEILDISPHLADKLFDIGINCGTARAARWLNVYLNANNAKGKLYKDIEAGPYVSPDTITALKAYIKTRGRRALPRLLLGLLCLQGHHYIALPEANEKFESFTYGWLARLEHNFQLYNDEVWK